MPTTRPGTLEERRAQLTAPSPPTDTGTAFIVGLAADGPINAATRLTSPADYLETYGDDSGTAKTLSDSVEAFFGEGGTVAHVARVDDLDAVVDDDWATALALFDGNLGPGQVFAPGRTGAVPYQQLLTHAAATNRTALLDPAFEDDKAALLTAVGLVDDVTDAERAGLFAQWLQIPDSTAGVDRFVPPSPVVAGLCARLPGEENRQPIAERGRLRFATALTTVFGDTDRTDLYEAGVNVFIHPPHESRPKLYGFRSVTTDPSWYDLAHQRLFMAVEGQAAAIAEQFVGDRITGDTITAFHGALEGYLMGLYSSGALFGASADEAFAVETADPVNSAVTAAARELSANNYIRAAEHAELVRTITVKVPVTASLV